MNTLLASVGRTLIESARSLPNLYRCGLSATPACNGHTFPQFANLPVSKLTGGKNNVYETRVDRKRVIRDPNLPDFEKIEKLDWATWGMLRDVRRRHLFVRYIEDRNCYKNLRRCKTLPNAIRVSFLYLLCFLTLFKNRKWPTRRKKNCHVIPNLSI